MTDFERARKVMVDNQLRTAGVTDRRVLAAMGEVPRETFVPGPRHVLAYIDDSHPLSATRKLGAPAPFAKLLQLAAVSHEERVLDLGCGTGYSAAVLARLGKDVVAVESDANLAGAARSALAGIGAGNVTVLEGDLNSAGAARGPYDVIVIEGAIAALPDGLFEQLKPEGRVAALIARAGRPAVAHLFVKSESGIASRAEFDAVLPPLAPAAHEEQFVF